MLSSFASEPPLIQHSLIAVEVTFLSQRLNRSGSPPLTTQEIMGAPVALTTTGSMIQP
jgi:hypothetical protein